MNELKEKYHQEKFQQQYQWLIAHGANQDDGLLQMLIGAKKLAEEVDIFCKNCGAKLTAWDTANMPRNCEINTVTAWAFSLVFWMDLALEPEH